MATPNEQSLEAHEKKELTEKEEKTVPARYYVPNADIFETVDALTLVLEMPGVDKDDIEIGLHDDVLTIEGHINFSKYESMQPVYTEYNVGHYTRKFSVGRKIDQDKITAEIEDGVLTLLLPKAEEAKPRQIKIN